MLKIKITIDDFKTALNELNTKLSDNHIVLELRSIGGFAMLYNGLRRDGYTMDIDTATKNITEDIQKLIKEVANEIDLPEDWINNDSYNLPEVKDALTDINWKKDDNYSNIELYIADIESLILLKARAVNFGGKVPRMTDKIDLLDLLSYIGIQSMVELRENKKIWNIISKYSICIEYLVTTEKW